ncbi:ABC transporter ATP-binding protein [Gammaproteobacteria bacterium]|nr:ABC transporter ATP-binding protein [Gammaproteobacteria bacterium]
MHSIRLEDAHYTLTDGHIKRELLKGCNLEIKPGEKILITGPSGIGKTSLLNIIMGFICPTKGDVFWGEENIKSYTQAKQSEIRAKHCGVVFQNPYFIEEMTVLENVVLPLRIQQQRINEAQVLQLAKDLGLSGSLLKQLPQVLSGGERTRANLLRALIHNPNIIFADEPTAALDYQLSQSIFKAFSTSEIFANKGLLVVSHDVNISTYFDQTYRLINGTLEKKDV